MLQFKIAVLRDIGHSLSLLYLVSCRKGIVYHEHNAIDRNLGKEGCDEKNRKLRVKGGAEAFRRPVADQEGLCHGHSQHEGNEQGYLAQSLCPVPYVRVIPSDIQHVKGNHGYKCRRIGEDLDSRTDYVGVIERFRREKKYDADPQDEDDADGCHEPLHLRREDVQTVFLRLLCLEQPCDKHTRPAEHFCREGRCYDIGNRACSYYRMQKVGADMSQQITEDVRHYHTGCGILYAYPFLHADEQDHRDGEDGQKKFVVESGLSAYKSDGRMQQSKYMDDPGYVYVFKFSHRSYKSLEDNKIVRNTQSLLMIRHRISAIHRTLLTIRQFTSLHLSNYDYLRKLIY